MTYPRLRQLAKGIWFYGDVDLSQYLSSGFGVCCAGFNQDRAGVC